MSEQQSNNSGFETLKTILFVISIITAIKFLQELFGKGPGDKLGEENDQKARIEREKLYKKFPPTYGDDQYRDWGDTLAMALTGGATEDEQAVYDIFEMVKNPSDVAKLVEFFGKQREMFTTHDITLPQAINIYFSTSEKKKLNKILDKKKIPYYFK